MAGKSAEKKSDVTGTKKKTRGKKVVKSLPVLQELATYMDEHDLVELKWSDGDTSYHLKKAAVNQLQAMPAPAFAARPQTAPPAAEKTAEEDSHLVVVESPIVGAFYRSPSPTASPYVEIGDRVDVGTVLCIVEAMKLMNEIQSQVKGTVKKILVKNEDTVTVGQKLFLIEPEGV